MSLRAAGDLLQVFAGQFLIGVPQIGKDHERVYVLVALDEAKTELPWHLHTERVMDGAMRLDEQSLTKDNVGFRTGEHCGERIPVVIRG